MKSITILLTQILFCTLLQGTNYVEGDKLNVFAKSGLNLRTGHNISFEKIIRIPFGEEILILNTFGFEEKYNDEIEELKGHWVYVEYGNYKGYVFDGFISKLRIPDYSIDEEFECNEIGIIDKYLNMKYGIDTYSKNYPKKSLTIVDSSDNCGHEYYESVVEPIGKYRFHLYYEGVGAEIVFEGFRESEILNLAKLLLKRCPFMEQKLRIMTIQDGESRFEEYKNKECCKSVYLYRKGNKLSFMINSYL